MKYHLKIASVIWPDRQGAVTVHRVLHLLRWLAFEVYEFVCMPVALHLQHPVNGYKAPDMQL